MPATPRKKGGMALGPRYGEWLLIRARYSILTCSLLLIGQDEDALFCRGRDARHEERCPDRPSPQFDTRDTTPIGRITTQ
jgi:hypothetical protein